MAVECRPRAIWFVLRIEMEHNPGDMTPVSTFRIRVEQAQIRDDVLFVIECRPSDTHSRFEQNEPAPASGQRGTLAGAVPLPLQPRETKHFCQFFPTLG